MTNRIVIISAVQVFGAVNGGANGETAGHRVVSKCLILCLQNIRSLKWINLKVDKNALSIKINFGLNLSIKIDFACSIIIIWLIKYFYDNRRGCKEKCAIIMQHDRNHARKFIPEPPKIYSIGLRCDTRSLNDNNDLSSSCYLRNFKKHFNIICR